MAKQEQQYWLVKLGDKEMLVEAATALKAQQMALNSVCTARKASVHDVVRLGAAVLRAPDAKGE